MKIPTILSKHRIGVTAEQKAIGEKSLMQVSIVEAKILAQEVN